MTENKGDLISREALKKAGYENGYSMEQAKYQRPQGEWTQSETDRFYHTNNWKCSNCHSIYVIWNDPLNHNYNYCPHCGADMRGKKNDRK